VALVPDHSARTKAKAANQVENIPHRIGPCTGLSKTVGTNTLFSIDTSPYRPSIPEPNVPTHPSFTEQFSDVRTRTDDSRAAYLQKQLTLFQSGRRGGSAYQHPMTGFAKELTKDDISALSAYFSIRQYYRHLVELEHNDS